MANQSKPAFRFLDLPPELRLRTYSYLLAQNATIAIAPWYDRSTQQYRTAVTNLWDGIVHKKPSGMTVGLLRACKLIYEEATPVLYGDNSFVLRCHERLPNNFLQKLGSSVRNLRRVSISNYSDKKERRRAFSLLQQATMLAELSIPMCMWHNQWASEKIAKEVGPLIRSLHKAQKKDAARKGRNVLDVLKIRLQTNMCLECFENPGVDRKHENEVKGLVAKTLK